MPLTKISQARLATAHPDLQRLVLAVNARTPVYVLCGNRSNLEQAQCFQNGTSKAKPGESPHNFLPSLAIDLQPVGHETMDELGAVVLEEAGKLGLEITWGGTFSFVDKFHFEFRFWKQMIPHYAKKPLP